MSSVKRSSTLNKHKSDMRTYLNMYLIIRVASTARVHQTHAIDSLDATIKSFEIK